MKAGRMPDLPSPFIFDVQALLAWSNASGNEAQTVLTEVEQEGVLIYNRVWKEFCDAYPEEGEKLKALSLPRKRVTEEHRMAAVALAEKCNATFGWQGPYDHGLEWCVAAIASSGPYTIVTDARRK